MEVRNDIVPQWITLYIRWIQVSLMLFGVHHFCFLKIERINEVSVVPIYHNAGNNSQMKLSYFSYMMDFTQNIDNFTNNEPLNGEKTLKVAKIRDSFQHIFVSNLQAFTVHREVKHLCSNCKKTAFYCRPLNYKMHVIFSLVQVLKMWWKCK